MKHPNTFDEHAFRVSVDNALIQVKRILDTTRHPRLAQDEDHVYEDKFALVDYMTQTSILAQVQALAQLGLTTEKLETARQWVQRDKSSVTLRFQAQDTCSFLQQVSVKKVVADYEVEQEKTTSSQNSGGFFSGGTNTNTVKQTHKSKVTTTVQEYHYKVQFRYQMVLFAGTDNKKTLELDVREGSTVIVIQGGPTRPSLPFPEKTVHPAVDADLTWLLQQVDQNGGCTFSIDRTKATCRTPRRNEQIDKALESEEELVVKWARRVVEGLNSRLTNEILRKHNPVHKSDPNTASGEPGKFPPGSLGTVVSMKKEANLNGQKVRVVEYLADSDRYKVEPIRSDSGLPKTLLLKEINFKPDDDNNIADLPTTAPPLHSIHSRDLFCPVLPVLEKKSVLPSSDQKALLEEQKRSLGTAVDKLAKLYPPRQLEKLVSTAEATICLVCVHLVDLHHQYVQCVGYMEELLRRQLVQAIGKEVGRKDFDDFMRFYHVKLFGRQYAPRPFSYAIRRPNHYPDGVMTIESVGGAGGEAGEPIQTWTRHIPAGASTYVAINAATSVEITGDRYLHGWMQHEFGSGGGKDSFHATFRARQFSSFLVLVGTMVGPDKFDPKDAIILQNKDEVLIPLLTNVLPSAKEFKDAISSLSPEQQSFAKAFRSMQLESSVFGVCVIQLKPQLEKLLGLPDGALTKEIQLTQDLMSLFIEYQIPSDLLSFDEAAAGGVGGDGGSTSVADKVSSVKGYVKSVLDVIEGAKQEQLRQEVQKADMRAEQAYAVAPPVQFGAHPFASAAPPSGVAPASFSQFSGRSAKPMASVSRRKAAGGFGMSSAVNDLNSVAAFASEHNTQPRAHFSRMLEGRPEKSPSAIGAASTVASLRSAPTPNFDPFGGNVDNVKESPAESHDSSSTSQPHMTDENHHDDQATQEDFTMIPKVLDSKLETYDTDSALKSAIIKADTTWTRLRKANLLTPLRKERLTKEGISEEKKKAFDLLDAISRSGTLPIACAELHVVIAVSHCFENDVMGTVIQDNINPIEKVERSSLLLASSIYGTTNAALIENTQDVARLQGTFPLLFDNDDTDNNHEPDANDDAIVSSEVV